MYIYSSVAQSYPTLCSPMDCSTSRLPCPSPTPGAYSNSFSLSWLIPSNHLILCHPFFSCLLSFPASGSFPMSQLFVSGGQSTVDSALALVLPMNIEDWFPLGLTCWISLQSKRPSRVFYNTTVQKHQFFCWLLAK